MTEITYKYLSTEDEVQQVYKLMAIPAIYKFTGPPLVPPAIRNGAKKLHFIVAKSGDRVVGFINFNKNKDGYSVVHYRVTHPDYQRMGIALGLTRYVPPPLLCEMQVRQPADTSVVQKAGNGMCWRGDKTKQKRENL